VFVYLCREWRSPNFSAHNAGAPGAAEADLVKLRHIVIDDCKIKMSVTAMVTLKS
jgi:hypothetical protein